MLADQGAPATLQHASSKSSDTRYMLPPIHTLQQPTVSTNPMIMRSKAANSKGHTLLATSKPTLVQEALSIPD